MREHRLQRLLIHLSLELMPIFERHGLLRRRPRTDFVGQPLQIRKFLPGAVAKHGGNKSCPSPDVHINDRVGRNAWPSIAISGAVDQVPIQISLSCRETVCCRQRPNSCKSGPETAPEIQLIDCRDPSVRTNPREIGPACEEAANLHLHKTAWWARELSHIKQSQLLIKGAGK